MGSQTELPRIPIIDFSKEELKLAASSSWLSLCNKIQYALENHGCFIAKYDQLSPELSKKIFSQTKDMFEVPTEIKMKNTSHVPYRGYHTGPSDPNMPRFEGLGIDNATSLEETQKFMNLMWPAGKDQLCEVVNSYAKLLGDLIEFIYEMVFESYGARKHYASFAASNSHVLRFLKLKPKDASLTTNIRFQSHKDLSFATIVHQIDIPGLEVQAKDGTWIAIQPQPSHFVFLASEAMQVWSNDRIKACNHRVTMSGSGERYSLGLFTFNNGVIQVPEELVDDKNPLLYKPFDHPEFIRFFLDADLATRLNNPIKTFCGV
ncbi:deoxypodophyllotoxin synthase-like [Ziziphus jujuba]|uniref:Deoxypodophyllotoxin synthase n=1 Tax=Ziziphus jujuba TaxID=326968 RepID=A0A6P3Z0M6_ZIZJJ|nr:deoxypodophyllotoxin synthase [Ziziphus jujuba]XP_060670854.1 deoxypodophyllotoxin synthase-like [Ziziphus jujuba]